MQSYRIPERIKKTYSELRDINGGEKGIFFPNIIGINIEFDPVIPGLKNNFCKNGNL